MGYTTVALAVSPTKWTQWSGPLDGSLPTLSDLLINDWCTISIICISISSWWTSLLRYRHDYHCSYNQIKSFIHQLNSSLWLSLNTIVKTGLFKNYSNSDWSLCFKLTDYEIQYHQQWIFIRTNDNQNQNLKFNVIKLNR